MSKIINTLVNKKCDLPIWFMRQAGRHLPEFRKIRSQNKNFINLCLNSNLSSEITLQPIKRYNLDAAIIFSDILLVPFALGQNVDFKKNEGPVLSTFNKDAFFKENNKNFSNKLNPIYDAIKKTRKQLSLSKSLISFVGAPWTLLVYMFNLKKNRDEIDDLKYKSIKKEINIILDTLINYLCLHIENQINAGADVVQIFDSWAGLLPEEDLNNFCYKPNAKIVKFCKSKKIPVICFPKGIKKNYLQFNKIVKPDGLSLDHDIDIVWAKNNLKDVVLQGGMNPLLLLKEEEKIFNEAKKYLDTFRDVPYIFNLGHGLVPETDPDKLEKLINFVKEYK